MITKESLLEAKDSINEAVLRIKQKYSRNVDNKTIFFVVEGNDDIPFYATKGETFLPENWKIEMINARNRKKVVDAYNKIDWNVYDKNRILFFIDRDLSDYTGEETPTSNNLYVTSKYSIENDLCTVETYLKVVKFYFHLEDIDENDELALNEFYNSCWCEFEKFSIKIMAQILFWKVNNIGSNYSNFKIQNIFFLHNNALCLKDEYINERALLQAFCLQCNVPFNEHNLTPIISQLNSIHTPYEYIRGKYIVTFFVKLLKYTSQHSDMIIPSKRKAKDTLSVGFEDCVLKLCGIMSVPVSLKNFFERMKEAIMN